MPEVNQGMDGGDFKNGKRSERSESHSLDDDAAAQVIHQNSICVHFLGECDGLRFADINPERWIDDLGLNNAKPCRR